MILEIQLEAMIEGVGRYTWKPCLSEFGAALGGRDRESKDIHLEDTVKQNWRSTCRRSMDGLPGAETLFIS